MISAFARASEVLDDKRHLESARKCAQFIRDQLYDEQEGFLHRTWRAGSKGNIRGFAEDYSFLIQAMLGAMPFVSVVRTRRIDRPRWQPQIYMKHQGR